MRTDTTATTNTTDVTKGPAKAGHYDVCRGVRLQPDLSASVVLVVSSFPLDRLDNLH